MTNDPIDLLLTVALYETCGDYYFSESAAHLLAGLWKLDDESAAVAITLAAYEAEGELMRN